MNKKVKTIGLIMMLMVGTSVLVSCGGDEANEENTEEGHEGHDHDEHGHEEGDGHEH